MPVRPALAKGWEDVQLDFLVAGFARSGTHSLRQSPRPAAKWVVVKITVSFWVP